VLRHRMILAEGVSVDEVLKQAMDGVPTSIPTRVA